MLKLRIKFDIGILRWFSNLAKNSSLNPLLSFPKPTSHRLENQSLNMIFACELIKKTRDILNLGNPFISILILSNIQMNPVI
jgi:hypothetical protein